MQTIMKIQTKTFLKYRNQSKQSKEYSFFWVDETQKRKSIAQQQNEHTAKFLMKVTPFHKRRRSLDMDQTEIVISAKITFSKFFTILQNIHNLYVHSSFMIQIIMYFNSIS